MRGNQPGVSWYTAEEQYQLRNMVSGTTFQGEVVASYATLVARFGQPHRTRHSNAEWAINFTLNDGEVIFATVSDEQKLLPPGQVTHWQIAGFRAEAAECIFKALWDVISVFDVTSRSSSGRVAA